MVEIFELTKREIKEIEEIIRKNYGANFKFKDIVFKTSKDKIWILSRMFKNIDISRVVINSAGLYFGRLKRNKKIKLSIEGAQLIGENATKNIVEVDEEEAKRFIQGLNIKRFKKVNAELNNFVLVKYKKDILGVGILRETHVENLLPKSRRIYLDIKKD